MNLREKYLLKKDLMNILINIEYSDFSGVWLEQTKKNIEILKKQLELVILKFENNIKEVQFQKPSQIFLDLLQSIKVDTNENTSIRYTSSVILLNGYISQEHRIAYPTHCQLFKSPTSSYMFITSNLGNVIRDVRKKRYYDYCENLLSLYNCLCYHIKRFFRLQYDLYFNFIKDVSTILYLLLLEVSDAKEKGEIEITFNPR